MKIRTITRTRMVPHTIDGITHTVPESYTVDVPIPPRDWDRVITLIVNTITILLVIASVAWSTASIGDLLAASVTPVIAYAAAGVFDFAWIIAMALEWLCRYDQARARTPRTAGNIALLLAMSAVGTHGWITGNAAIGIIGAAISLMAKSVWALVMRDKHRPLDARTRAWLDHSEAEVAAALALASRQRQLARTKAQAALMAEQPLLEAEPRPQLLPAQPPRRTPPPSTPAGPVGTPVEDTPALLGRAHAPIVYFLSNGDRVKIGTSQNLKRRIDTLCLRTDDLLFALHGDQRTERELHARFTAHRVGNTEWFHIAGDLAEYIAEQTGTPLALPPAAAEAEATHPETPEAHQGASSDAPQATASPRITEPITKTAAILAAASALQGDASPASIAHLLAQQGLAVDTAYVRTVLSRTKKTPGDDVGKGGGGYA